MTAQKSPLDEIFSPERLREKWRADEETTPEIAQAEIPAAHPLALVDRLGELVGERFAAAEAEPLRTLINGLRERVGKCFPRDGAEGAAEERAALAVEIEELVGKIEDLADALQLRPRA